MFKKTFAASLLALSALVQAPSPRAPDGGVVTNCATDADLNAKLVGGGLITFACGTATIPFSSSKLIATDTTVDGGGAITLSGGTIHRLFNVTFGKTLTLTNITISDGGNDFNGVSGGAINNIGTFVARRVTFANNASATYNVGGAIISQGPMRIEDSLFINNEAGSGGAIHNLSPGEATIVNTTFISNTAHRDGGGAIANYAVLTMTGVLIRGNADYGTYASNTQHGGGGLANRAGGVAVLSDVDFVNNRMNFTSTLGGGGIANQGWLTITRGHLVGNWANGLGGGLMNALGARVALNAATFVSNTAQEGGGAYNLGNLVASGGVFERNATSNSGGGFAQFVGAASFDGTVFTGNTAPSGGGIYSGSSLALRNGRVEKNVASIAGAGVVSVIAYNQPLTISNMVLAQNNAPTRGGALYAYGGDVLVERSLLRQNTATLGGGIYVEGNNDNRLNIDRTTLDFNPASFGGGLDAFGYVTVTASTFFANSASDSGGAIFVLKTAVLRNSTLSGNSAGAGGGGGLRVGNLATAHLTDMTLAGNTAPIGAGGGINRHSASTVYLTATVLSPGASGGTCTTDWVTSAFRSLSADLLCNLTGISPGGGNAEGAGVSLLLGPLAWNGGWTRTHLPQTGSTAIDYSPFGLSTDQRGVARPIGIGYDVGAVETGLTPSNMLPFDQFVPSARRGASSAW